MPKKLVMGPDQNFLTWVGLDQFFDARVRSSQPPMNLENFPQNLIFSKIFIRGQKNLIGWGQKMNGSRAGRHLIY